MLHATSAGRGAGRRPRQAMTPRLILTSTRAFRGGRRRAETCKERGLEFSQACRRRLRRRSRPPRPRSRGSAGSRPRPAGPPDRPRRRGPSRLRRTGARSRAGSARPLVAGILCTRGKMRIVVPSFGRAVDLDLTVRLLHETVDHAEAEARALAALLGGEERLEDPLQDLGGMPMPVSATEITTYRRARRVAALDGRFSTAIVRSPPSGMASRALTARLSSAASNCARSTWTGQTSRPASSARVDALAERRASARGGPASDPDVIDRRACSGCRREKARRRWVRSAQRCAPSIAIRTRRCAFSLPSSAFCRRSRLPITTLSMLLKSCAMPPVSRPTASSLLHGAGSAPAACAR